MLVWLGNGGDMTGNRAAIWIVLALWGLAMGLSALAMTAEPIGDGFTRGLNRVTGFVQWQAAGMVLALIGWFAARSLPEGDRLRWLARMPGWWTGVLLLGLAIYVAASAWLGNRPPPEASLPPPHVTGPFRS
jgi:hypothetical protein